MKSFKEELDILRGDLENVHILVVGDMMLDRYIIGTSSRISPEAPVPVVLWKKTEVKLGGASNVAANLKAMGCTVSVLGLSGQDADAEILENLLKDISCDHIHLIKDPSRPTTVKTRIVSEHHQVARIDHESDHEISEDLINKALAIMETAFKKDQIQVIILQDYNKGLLHPGWINRIQLLAKAHGVKTAVDPKKNHFFNYQEVDLFKPNLKEALEVLNSSYKGISDLPLIADSLEDKLSCKNLMITLASEGIWFQNKDIQRQFTTRPRKVADVSGAGDTVISLAAICMACTLSEVFMANCCNAGGGQVCEKFGVVPVQKSELIRELEESQF